MKRKEGKKGERKGGRIGERTLATQQKIRVSIIKTHGPNFKRAMLGIASLPQRNWARQ